MIRYKSRAYILFKKNEFHLRWLVIYRNKGWKNTFVIHFQCFPIYFHFGNGYVKFCRNESKGANLPKISSNFFQNLLEILLSGEIPKLKRQNETLETDLWSPFLLKGGGEGRLLVIKGQQQGMEVQWLRVKSYTVLVISLGNPHPLKTRFSAIRFKLLNEAQYIYIETQYTYIVRKPAIRSITSRLLQVDICYRNRESTDTVLLKSVQKTMCSSSGRTTCDSVRNK